jgi:hypothetical protein
MPLATTLMAAAVAAHNLPTTEDPLDVQTMRMLRESASSGSAGQNYCAFDNGTRVPTSALPKDFFGPEPCVFSSGMVLRGNDPVTGGKGAAAGALVWGFADVGAVVSCSVDGAGSPVVATADNTGRWELVLQQKGGPTAHTLVFSTPGSAVASATKNVTLSNVLFGAVFLCSGYVHCHRHLLLASFRKHGWAWPVTQPLLKETEKGDRRQFFP